MEEEDMGVDKVAKTPIPNPVFELFFATNNLDDVVDGEVVTENLNSYIYISLTRGIKKGLSLKITPFLKLS